MFLWNTAFGRKTFGLKEDYAKQSAALAANQGLYNGFLSAGLIWSIISNNSEVAIFFLACVIIAGIYGAYSTKKYAYFIYNQYLQLLHLY
jgi:putative membrane protein